MCRAALLTIGAITTATAAARADDVPRYTEPLRPQFHFTSKTDWINDPNGLVFYDGEYHLFFQRVPGSNDGNTITKAWGHAVSTNLVHWTQLPDAISPDDQGSIWSGSAVVDWKNSSGFGKDGKPPLVAFYTNAKTPFDQRLAYSNDRGRTWTKVATPILANIHGQNRDPKVIWHGPTQRWVMALYLDEPSHYALFTSPDCKAWTKLQDVALEGDNECPDFFPLALDGDASKTKWIFTGASARYIVGTFDGKAFTPETDSLVGEHGPNFYAAQTFSDEPTGRRIQIGWMRDGRYPGMPFNQQMSFPCELTLRSTPRGPRLFRWPVKEIEWLYDPNRSLDDDRASHLSDHSDASGGLGGTPVDLTFVLDRGTSRSLTVEVGGLPIVYTIEGNGDSLSCFGRRVALRPNDAHLRLRLLIDRTSLEIFANDGEAVLSGTFAPDPQTVGFKISCVGGDAILAATHGHALQSAWQTAASTTQP